MIIFGGGDFLNLIFSETLLEFLLFTNEHNRDDVKEKFLKCLRCLHSIIKRTNDQQNETLLGEILKNNNLEKLIRILTWTSDLFLLSSTCLSLIDISQTSTGHKNFIECLFHISKQDSNKYITAPLICALQLINPSNTTKSARICGVISSPSLHQSFTFFLFIFIAFPPFSVWFRLF